MTPPDHDYSRKEDTKKMKELARGEIEGELQHYLEDMGWSPRETLDRLWEWYDLQKTWHPSSKEVKSIKKMMIKFDVVEETTEEELSKIREFSTSGSMQGRKATELFVLDGQKYKFNDWKSINDDRREEEV